jgi:hypothetical protein
MIEEDDEAGTDVVVGVNAEENNDDWRISDVDRLVCVFKCIRSSSLLTNLFPQ